MATGGRNKGKKIPIFLLLICTHSKSGLIWALHLRDLFRALNQLRFSSALTVRKQMVFQMNRVNKIARGDN